MMYCRPCASFRHWPFDEAMFRSVGTCEICERPRRACVDVPSRHLSIPDFDKEDADIEQLRASALAGNDDHAAALEYWDIPLSGWHPFGNAKPRPAATEAA